MRLEDIFVRIREFFINSFELYVNPKLIPEKIDLDFNVGKDLTWNSRFLIDFLGQIENCFGVDIDEYYRKNSFALGAICEKVYKYAK